MDNKISLLFGMPRSGTTWIGKVFDSHPDVIYLHEPDSRSRIDEIPLFVRQQNAADFIPLIRDFVNSFPIIRNVNVMSKLPLFDKNYFSLVQKYLLRLSLYASKVTRAEELFYLPSYGNVSDVNYVWKSIESLGRLYTCLQTSEQYRAIHIMRHPCGQIASVIKGESINKFSGNYHSSEDYPLFEMMLDTDVAEKYKLSLSELKQMSPVERLAWKWVIYNEKAFNDCNDMSHYTLAVYEKLCASPLDEYKKLFAHVGLNWNKQTENFLNKSTLKNSESYYSVYKDPKESASKWKKVLESSDIKKIMNIVEKSPLIEYID